VAPDTLSEPGARNLTSTASDELRCARPDKTSRAMILSGLDSPEGVAVDPHTGRIYSGTHDGIVFTETDVRPAEARPVIGVYPDETDVGAVVLSR
jgi:hypothetical protein